MQFSSTGHQGSARMFQPLSPVCDAQAELGSPALAFVKTLCHLLALDSAVLDEVLVLRRQLLRLIHCKEFSQESEFKVGVILVLVCWKALCLKDILANLAYQVLLPRGWLAYGLYTVTGQLPLAIVCSTNAPNCAAFHAYRSLAQPLCCQMLSAPTAKTARTWTYAVILR